MNDHFDTILSDGLRHRAAAAIRPSRGLGDVRRRVRRRRQRHMAAGLVPAVAGLGWAVTRPVGHTPLSPAGGAGPCDQTQPTWNDTLPANPTSTIAYIEAGGSTIVITAPIPTTLIRDADGNIVGSYSDTVTLPITTDPFGNVVVPYTGPTAPPWMVEASTSVLTDSDGGAVVVDTTWSGNATTTTIDEVTTTTICRAVPLPDSSIPSSESAPKSDDTVTATTAVPGDFVSTKVQVANCSTQSGAAGLMTRLLSDEGFATVEATDGTCDPRITASYLIFDPSVPGAQSVAETVAAVLGGLGAEPGTLPIKTASGDWAAGSGVVLLLGSDLAGDTISEIEGRNTAGTTTSGVQAPGTTA